MIDFVKGFMEIEEDSVYLAWLVEVVSSVLNHFYQLRFAAPALPESVLEACKNAVCI